MWRALSIIIVLSAAIFWLATQPRPVVIELPHGNAENGEMVAIAAGCASCHGADLSGGKAIASPFGTFYAPNITPYALQHWTKSQFFNAMIYGNSPDNKHLYPSFPYSSYQDMNLQDLADLEAYLQSVPSVEKANTPHDLNMMAKWRRPAGVWKLLRGTKPAPIERGGYLVETLGHCQECHTPRNALGHLIYKRSFEGGVVYGLDAKVTSKAPSLITGDSADWDKAELVEYFTSGFTPDFDSAGGEMVEVIENLSRLPLKDREAIADYILSLNK